jgi:hypothetical protein
VARIDGLMSEPVPFVVVESQGGPYDDEAFASGYQLGMLNMGFFSDDFPSTFCMPMYRQSVRQADLIAMRHGWVTSVEDEVDEEWVILSFRRSRPIAVFA